jgi:DNA (cytosine-5)-methyltransferase 1
VNELNKSAMGTYLSNRPEYPSLRDRFSCSDVKELVDLPKLVDLKSALKKVNKIRDIDLVVGGPPCQGYSGIGHRRSYSVEKKQLPSNHLYQDMAFVIHVLRPKLFLFENVRGLQVSRWTREGEKGEIWRDVQATFHNIPGYDVHADLVFAKDYGVPQNRPRLLLVGVREDIGVSLDPLKAASGLLPEAKGGYPSISDLLSDLVDSRYEPGAFTDKYPERASTGVQRELRRDPRTGRVRRKGSRVTEHKYSKHSPRIVEKFQHMLDNNGALKSTMETKKFAQRVLPSIWTGKGPTITATSLPDDYVHYKQPRSLTVREWARIQTFPDWYQFEGPRTTGGLRRAGNPRDGLHSREVPKYTQIGNAVPVKLAYELGQHFQDLLA